MGGRFDGMVLYVHAGAGKTGSTTIQMSLRESQSQLRQFGISYAGLNFEYGCSRRFGWQKPNGWDEVRNLGENRTSQLVSVMRDCIETASNEGLRAVVWSNESLFSELDKIKDALRVVASWGVAIVSVCYVRRHDFWSQSAYAQWGIKHKVYSGRLLSFSNWSKRYLINYSGNIRKWKDVPGVELMVRNFDATEDVLSDFLEVLSLSPDAITRRSSNETPSLPVLKLWALHNNEYEEPVLPAELEGLFNEAGAFGVRAESVSLEALLPSESDLRKVLLDTAEDQAEVSRFLEEGGQKPFSKCEVKAKRREVSSDEVDAVLLWVVKSQYKMIKKLQSRVKSLSDRVEKIEKDGAQ